jgi:hypothetical protein
MIRTLAALAVLPLALAGAGWVSTPPHSAQRRADAPVPVTQEARGSPGAAFQARFGAAYAPEEPPQPATRPAAGPVAMQGREPPVHNQGLAPFRSIRNADRAEHADSRPALCERHHMRKVWISKYRWRCRR